MRKKLLSILLSLSMIAGMLSTFAVSAFADDETIVEESVFAEEPTFIEESVFAEEPTLTENSNCSETVLEEDDDDYDDEWDEPEILPVKNLKTTNIKWNSATLTWRNPGDVDGYDIYIEQLETRQEYYHWTYKEEILIEDPATVSYKVQNLLPCRSYSFRVIPYRNIDGYKRFADYWECKCIGIKTPPCPDGSFYTSNRKLAKRLTIVIKKYKENAKFKKSGQCYGYAEWGSKQIAKTRKKTTINKKFTKKNVEKYIVGLKAGAHVRIKRSGMEHSVLIIKSTKNSMCWVDCNWNHDNRVHYSVGTAEDFYYQYFNYSKILWIMKTKTYR